MSDKPASQADTAPRGTQDDRSPVGNMIERLTRGLALVGGSLLVLTVALTLISVSGRYVFGKPVPGDYELVELICGVAVFLFFPYTHATDSNIRALFFTSGLPVRYQRLLDLIHDTVFAAVAALLTWRLSAGLAGKYLAGETSILIRIPLWWAFAFAVASMALLTLVCLWRIAARIQEMRR